MSGSSDSPPDRQASATRWLTTAMRPELFWFLAIASAGVLGYATTEGTMGVPADPRGMGALLAVLATLGAVLHGQPEGRNRRRLRSALLLLGLAVLGALAAQEAWKPGYVRGHDVRYHAWAYYASFRAALDGDLWPRWNPYLAFGLPLFQFYGPMPYVLAWPAQALGAPPDRAMSFVLVVTQVATGFSTFLSARWLGASRGGSVLAAASLILLPYHLLDQNLRHAMGEIAAFPLLPPLFVAVWRCGITAGRVPVLVFALSLAALVLSHVLSVITTAVACVPLALLALRDNADRVGALKRWTGGAALALLLSGFFWVPMAAEAHHTSVDRVVGTDGRVARWAAEPGEAFRRRLWPRYGVRQARDESDDPGRGMPMYAGVTWMALLALALSGPGWVRTPPRVADPPRSLDPRPFAVAALCTLLLATWPTALFLDLLRVFSRLQFPWRLYLPMGGLLALAAALSFDRAFPQRSTVRSAALFCTLLALGVDASPYLGAPDRMEGGDRPGATYVSGRQIATLPIETGVFVRVEELALPPGDYEARVGMVRMMFPEYMRPRLREELGRRRQAPTDERLAELGVRFRVGEGGRRARELDPAPLVRWVATDLPLSFERGPEWFRIELGEGHRGGRVRVAESWFPGWLVRIDGEPWRAAEPGNDWLAAAVPAGARTLEFRFSGWVPWDRTVGRIASLLGLLGFVWLALRRRQPA